MKIHNLFVEYASDYLADKVQVDYVFCELLLLLFMNQIIIHLFSFQSNALRCLPSSNELNHNVTPSSSVCVCIWISIFIAVAVYFGDQKLYGLNNIAQYTFV